MIAMRPMNMVMMAVIVVMIAVRAVDVGLLVH